MSKTKYTREGLNIHATAVAVAEKLAKELKIGQGGVADPFSKEFSAEVLETVGLTPAEVKKYDTAIGHLVAGTALATGEAGLDYFAKHKDAQQVSAELKVGSSTLSITTDRHKSYPNRMGGEGAPNIEKYGITNARFTVASAGNRGDFKKVREHLGSQAAGIFG